MIIRCFTIFSTHLWVLKILSITHILSIIFYSFIEFILLLYTFLAFSLASYKEYIIWQISDVLAAFTCAGAIGNLWSICLEVLRNKNRPEEREWLKIFARETYILERLSPWVNLCSASDVIEKLSIYNYII